MKTKGEEMAENAIISINHKMPQIELRDLFAMNALNGMLAGCVFARNKAEMHELDENDERMADVADIAYEFADAMLEARKRK